VCARSWLFGFAEAIAARIAKIPAARWVFTLAGRDWVSNSEFPLLAGIDLGGNETHLVYAGRVDLVNDLGYVGEVEVFIAPDECDLLCPRLENVFQTPLQGAHRDIVLVNLERAVFEDLDDDGAILRIGLLLGIPRRLGNQRVEALGRERRDDHEDDQQHEQHVDQRRHSPP
jgi:hypothetical protein